MWITHSTTSSIIIYPVRLNFCYFDKCVSEKQHFWYKSSDGCNCCSWDFAPGEERTHRDPQPSSAVLLLSCSEDWKEQRVFGIRSPLVLASGQVIKNNITIPRNLTDFITSACHLHHLNQLPLKLYLCKSYLCKIFLGCTGPGRTSSMSIAWNRTRSRPLQFLSRSREFPDPSILQTLFSLARMTPARVAQPDHQQREMQSPPLFSLVVCYPEHLYSPASSWADLFSQFHVAKYSGEDSFITGILGKAFPCRLTHYIIP